MGFIYTSSITHWNKIVTGPEFKGNNQQRNCAPVQQEQNWCQIQSDAWGNQ